jgi:hypothetical protein
MRNQVEAGLIRLFRPVVGFGLAAAAWADAFD